jgi:hypothetical protein
MPVTRDQSLFLFQKYLALEVTRAETSKSRTEAFVMPVPIVAVGAFALVKMGAIMGQHSCQNYDPNPGSAYDRKKTLPGTDGRPVDLDKQKKKKFDEEGKPSKE